MRTSASPKLKTAEFFMSKYLTQEEANKFFDKKVDEVGPQNVTHQLLSDASGIDIKDAYRLYINWFANKE